MRPTLDRDDVRMAASIQGAILDRDAMRGTSAPETVTGPQAGDVLMLGPEYAGQHLVRRIAHVWRWADDIRDEWAIQPTVAGEPGSFHYPDDADRGSYSGGLVTRDPDGEFRPVRGWIWHHGHRRAHNGVTVTVFVPVWRVSP